LSPSLNQAGGLLLCTLNRHDSWVKAVAITLDGTVENGNHWKMSIPNEPITILDRNLARKAQVFLNYLSAILQ